MLVRDFVKGRADRVHVMMTAYNGAVILLLALFMGVTQQKISAGMVARDFLYRVSQLPMPAEEMLLGAVCSFTVVACCGYIYSNVRRLPQLFRYCVFFVEVASCIFLLHSTSLFYDGVVLLLLADFMYCYQGEKQLKIMLLLMLVVYGVIVYSASMLKMDIISFDVYLAYYSSEVQGILLAVRKFAGYGNIMFFVVYMVVLLQDKSKENAEIADLNYRMIMTNEMLNESNNRLNESNTELNLANKKLREYAMTIASLTEIKERNRLAREIHDTLGHALTGIVAGLDACMVTVDYAPEVTKKQLAKIKAAAQRGITDVRRSMHMLRPDDLEKLVFRDALRKLVEDFSDASGVEVELQFDSFPENLRQDQTDVLYRIVQESLTNASRHGHASRVKIFMAGAGEMLNIIISDNGVGCPEIKKGFGLHHMAERVELLGGTLAYWGEKGFVLEVNLPRNMQG